MFEWVKSNVYSLVVTLNPTNITLNSSAAAYFQDIRWCMIGIDKKNLSLAIRPVTKREVDLQLVSKEQLHKVSIGKGYARISNKAIIEELSILLKQTIDGLKMHAQFSDKENMLVFDLSELMNVKG